MDNNNWTDSHSVIRYRRSLSVLLSVSIAFGGASGYALAEPSTGGSITIDFLNEEGKPIPEGLLKKGDVVHLRANAHDAFGNSIQCTPTFSPIQGFSGQQIESIEGNIMTMGDGFGSAEVTASCAELPGVTAKSVVANRTLLTPAEKAAAAEKEAAKTSSGGVGKALLIGGVVVGAGALIGLAAAAAAANSSSSSSSQQQVYARYGGSDHALQPYTQSAYNYCVNTYCPKMVNLFGYASCTCVVY